MRKKIRNPYMKFQNISIHGSKLMLCTWMQQIAKKLQRAITPNKISLNWLNIYSGTLLLSSNQYTKYQDSSSNTFWDILLTRCYFIKRAITLKWEIIRIRKKIRVTYFIMRNPYMNFQNISKYGSKLMLCTWKQQAQIVRNCKGS